MCCHFCGVDALCSYLHSVVLSVVVCDGLQERLCVITEGYSAGVKFGFIWSGGSQGAAVVFILLFIVVIMDLTGLQTPREYGRLEPLCAKRCQNTAGVRATGGKTKG